MKAREFSIRPSIIKRLTRITSFIRKFIFENYFFHTIVTVLPAELTSSPTFFQFHIHLNYILKVVLASKEDEWRSNTKNVFYEHHSYIDLV